MPKRSISRRASPMAGQTCGSLQHAYPEGRSIANSAALAECPSNGLQRLSCLSGHLFGKVREILCLFGQPFDLLAHVCGRQFEEL